ncbi:MAG: MFS transporter [Pseudomonadota bacterium]
MSLFLPLEQAALARLAAGRHATTSLFARYNVVGSFSGALGALAVALPEWLARWSGLAVLAAERSVFLVYGAVGGAVTLLYSKLEDSPVVRVSAAPLFKSRRAVLRLAALFSLDSFGGGFVVQSLLALWLFSTLSAFAEYRRSFLFRVEPRVLALAVLVAALGCAHRSHSNHGLHPCSSEPAADGRRVHADAELTLLCLVLRAIISSMDVPARQAYVMSVVPPEERAAAASVTNVPRSLASAVAPTLAGLLLERTDFGWPLLCAGALKVTYDVLLLALFRKSEQQLELEA